MDVQARLILVTTMTAVMVLMVTLVATFLNIGLRSDFVFQWIKAYLVAWPVAAITATSSCPQRSGLTTRIVNQIDGKA